MSKESSSGAAVFSAFVLGALAGAALALLYAPAPGAETRKRLAERARTGRDRAQSMVREGQEALRRHRDQIGHAFDRGREAFDQARKETL
jgi:gas vesicle protein